MFNPEELKLKIYDKNDEVLFDEIVICINNDAFRSASILIWISIAESLKNKLNILAKDNKKIKKDMKNYEKKRIDSLLIEYSKNWKLINETEYYQLKTIITDRNNFAHPNFESPTKEKVICYLNFAVSYVLSKPPYFTYNYSKNFFKNYLSAKPYYFKSKSNEQIREYAKSFVRRLDKNNLNKILNCLFEIIEELYENYDERKINCINNCLIYLDELLSQEEIKISDDEYNKYLNNYPKTSCNIFTFEENWKRLDLRTQSRIFYESKSEIFSKIEFINIFNQLFESNLLPPEFEIEFEETIKELPLESLINYDLNYDYYYEKIISYLNEFEFKYQISAVNSLKILDLDKFNEEQLYQIGHDIFKKAIENSWACQEVIDNTYSKKTEKYLKKPILRGMMDKAIENPYGIYFNYEEYIRKLLNILHEFDEEKNILNESLKKFELKTLVQDEIGEYLKSIDNFKELQEDSLIYDETALIIKYINEMACKSINRLIDENPSQILTYFDFRKIAEYIYDCLTESKREKFSKLAFKETENFIEFFTDYEVTTIDGKENYSLIIRWELIDKFVDYTELKEHIERSFSKYEKVIETFLNR